MTWIKTKTTAFNYHLSTAQDLISCELEWDDWAVIKFESGQELRDHIIVSDFHISLEIRRAAMGNSSAGTMHFEESSSRGSGSYLWILFEMENDRYSSLLEAVMSGIVPKHISIEFDAWDDWNSDRSITREDADLIPIHAIGNRQYLWKDQTIGTKHFVKDITASFVLLDNQTRRSPTAQKDSRVDPLMTPSEQAQWVREQTQSLREIKTWIKRLGVLAIVLAVVFFVRSLF